MAQDLFSFCKFAKYSVMLVWFQEILDRVAKRKYPSHESRMSDKWVNLTL